MMFYHIVAVVAAFAGAALSETPQPELLCLNPSKLYPDHDDCRRFIRCVNRKPVSFSCPPKTAFDPETQICVWRLHLGDCDQEQTGPIWTTAAAPTIAQKILIEKGVSPGSSQNDVTEMNPFGSYFEDVTSHDDKTQDFFNDFDKILDIPKQTKSSNLQGRISSSASKSQIKNLNSNMHNVHESKSFDVHLKSAAFIPVISDKPVVTTGKDNSRYYVDEGTSGGDNLKSTLNEDLGNENISEFILNDISTKLYSLTSQNPPGFETSTIDLEQRQQMKTWNDQTAVETSQVDTVESDGNKYATSYSEVLDMTEEKLKVTPSWLTRMIDNKDATTEHKLNNVMSSRDTTATTSAYMAAAEVVKSGETTTIHSPNLPKIINNIAETFTSAEIASDNTKTSLRNEQDENNVYDDTFQNSLADLNSDIHAQHVDRDRVRQEGEVDLPEAQSPQNQTEAPGNAEEGLAEDNITAILTPFSAISKLEPSKAKQVMPYQRLQVAKEELMPLEKVDQYGNSFKRRRYTHPEDPDARTNNGIPQPQKPTSSYTNNNKDTNLDVAKEIGSSSNLVKNLSKNDSFDVDKETNTTTQKYNKQIFEVRHNTSGSANNTEQSTPLSNNFQNVTKPLDKFTSREKSLEEHKQQLPISRKAINNSVVQENVGIPSSTNLRVNVDFSTLTSRTSLANRTHVTAAAGMEYKDKVNSSGTTLVPPQTEAKLNVSFMSVPYMIKGLVRPFRCPEPNGHFIDPHNCSVFYHCSRGQAYRRDCPYGQVFHLPALSCVSAHLAPACQKMDKTREEIDEERPFRCEKDGYFRDAKQCNVYYICASGTSMRMTCDPGTSFDVTYNLCLWNSDVHDCNKPQTVLRDEVSVKKLADTKVQTETSKLQTSMADSELHMKVPEMTIAQFDCPEAHGLYPDPNNCSVFIHCFKKIPYRHTCQADTVFSAEIGVCTWRQLVPECQTEENQTSPQETKMSTVVPPRSRLPQPDVVPEPYKRLVSNPESTDIDQQGNTVEVQDFTCPEISDGFYRDNLFCDIFHRCVAGTRFTFTCPSGTFFKIRGNLCDFWENVVDCTKDGLRIEAVSSLPEIATLPLPQPLPNELDIETVGIDADPVPCPESSGLFAHPRNCHQFLFCAQFIPLVLTCPESLLYNPLTLTCDLSKNVQCLRYDDYKKV